MEYGLYNIHYLYFVAEQVFKAFFCYEPIVNRESETNGYYKQY